MLVLRAEVTRSPARPFIHALPVPCSLLHSLPARRQNCNLWRLFDDIQDEWGSVESIIDFWGDHQEELAPSAGPGPCLGARSTHHLRRHDVTTSRHPAL